MEREELLFRIATKYMVLSKSEKKVADFIKNFNGKAEKLTMKKVAKEAGKRTIYNEIFKINRFRRIQ